MMEESVDLIFLSCSISGGLYYFVQQWLWMQSVSLLGISNHVIQFGMKELQFTFHFMWIIWKKRNSHFF